MQNKFFTRNKIITNIDGYIHSITLTETTIQ